MEGTLLSLLAKCAEHHVDAERAALDFDPDADDFSTVDDISGEVGGFFYHFFGGNTDEIELAHEICERVSRCYLIDLQKIDPSGEIASLVEAGEKVERLHTADTRYVSDTEQIPSQSQPTWVDAKRIEDRIAHEPAPDLIGRYQVECVVGEGGFGRVFRAFDPVRQQPVAIKVPRSNADDSHAANRILREAQIASSLSHPNICPIYEVGLTDNHPYIVMPFIEGPTLADAIAREGQLEADRALRLVLTLADALSVAHDNEVLHRDLKPANVMLPAHDTPVIMDFGLAVGEGWSGQAHERAGTPGYVAPEQLQGDNTCPATDVFSLGVILYELLTGRLPTEDIIEDVACFRKTRETSTRSDNGSPREFSWLFSSMLARRQSDRFPNCRAVADAIRHYLSNATRCHSESQKSRTVVNRRRLSDGSLRAKVRVTASTMSDDLEVYTSLSRALFEALTASDDPKARAAAAVKYLCEHPAQPILCAISASWHDRSFTDDRLDIYQNVIVKLLDAFRDPGFRTTHTLEFVGAVVRRCVFEFFRQRQRIRRREQTLCNVDAIRQIDIRPDIGRDLDHDDLLCAIRYAACSLSSNTRLVADACIDALLSGCSPDYTGIAHALGISESAVQRAWSRARRVIANELTHRGYSASDRF